MRDIAKELNISVVSVSKALSQKDGVSEAVREQIKKKADEMGYVYVNPANAHHANYIFGVLVSQNYISDSAFYYKLYQNLVMEFGKANYSCMLEIISHQDEKAGVIPNMLSGNRVNGIVVMGPVEEECLQKIVMTDIPTVFLDTYMADSYVDSVVSDSVYGSHMLTNYLIAKGHKRIAFVGNINATHSIMDRYLGYYKSLLQNGMKLNPDYIIKDREDDGVLVNYGFPKEMPDAFVCNCDDVAYRLVEQLKTAGYRVPEDVSVVGFDDYIYATLSNPQLTTFKVNMQGMAEAAVEIIEKKLNDKNYHGGRKVVCGDIVIRDSVADRRKGGRY